MKNETFESAIKKLELITKELESGEIDLDKSIEKYKEATELMKFCNDKLKTAESTINKIVNKEGNLEDFKAQE